MQWPKNTEVLRLFPFWPFRQSHCKGRRLWCPPPAPAAPLTYHLPQAGSVGHADARRSVITEHLAGRCKSRRAVDRGGSREGKTASPPASRQRATWLSACRRREKRPSSSTRQANEVAGEEPHRKGPLASDIGSFSQGRAAQTLGAQDFIA